MWIRFYAASFVYHLLKALPPGVFSDRLLVLFRYSRIFRRLPDLKNPSRYTEKMQRRKLYDRNPLLNILQDKYRVRDYVAEKIGSDYLVPLLQVCSSPEQLVFDTLPDRFVLKENHGCGLNLLVYEKASLDIEEAKKQAGTWLRVSHYRRSREWAYRDIPLLLLVKEFIDDGRGGICPVDFKVVCFDGIPRYLAIALDRGTDSFSLLRYILEDGEPKLMDMPATNNFRHAVSLNSAWPEIPDSTIPEIIRLASALAEGLDHLRVDFYQTDHQIYFGEMTLYSGSGFMRYDTDFDEWLGSWWQQPY